MTWNFIQILLPRCDGTKNEELALDIERLQWLGLLMILRS